MGKTIVQDYGPIYGEPVNGTVLGRPNGSYFVPLTNTISLNATDLYCRKATAYGGGTVYMICASDGTGGIAVHYYNSVAVAQDLASNIVIDLYSDVDLEDKIGTKSYSAGQFNIKNNATNPIEDTPEPTAGDTVYLVATLMNNGSPVAVSAVLQLEWVVS